MVNTALEMSKAGDMGMSDVFARLTISVMTSDGSFVSTSYKDK